MKPIKEDRSYCRNCSKLKKSTASRFRTLQNPALRVLLTSESVAPPAALIAASWRANTEKNHFWSVCHSRSDLRIIMAWMLFCPPCRGSLLASAMELDRPGRTNAFFAIPISNLCAMQLPPPSSPDGQLFSHTQQCLPLQPASFSRTQPTITISMASPHPSVTSLHNSPQTPQTPADYPHILPDSLMDFALDFAHLETGQCKNSPNAWKVTSKTAPCDPIAAKRLEEKKQSCRLHWNVLEGQERKKKIQQVQQREYYG